jgi:hypothetical protein
VGQSNQSCRESRSTDFEGKGHSNKGAEGDTAGLPARPEIGLCSATTEEVAATAERWLGEGQELHEAAEAAHPEDP